MTDPGGLSSWEYTEDDFNFELEVPKRIQRGWERAPKSPHAAHMKGRKVWKRPETRVNAPQATFGTFSMDGGRQALSDVSTNTPRAVKKLRLKDIPQGASDIPATKHIRYLTTLRDGVQGTPKRKHVQSHEQPRSLDGLESPRDSQSKGAVLEDPLKVSQSPAVGEIRQLMDSPISESETLTPLGALRPMADRLEHTRARLTTTTESVDEIEEREVYSTEKLMANSDPAPLEVVGYGLSNLMDSAGPYSSPAMQFTDANYRDTCVSESSESRPKTATNLLPDQEHKSSQTDDSTSKKATCFASPCKPMGAKLDPSTPIPAQTSIAESETTPLHENANLTRDNEAIVDSPQIGTTLLRRESLRRKESPGRHTKRNGRSPQKRQLKKRDTLQEREILQRFSEATSPVQRLPNSACEDVVSPRASIDVPTKPERDHSAVPVPEQAAEQNSLEGELLNNEELETTETAIKSCEEATRATGVSVSIADMIEASNSSADVEQCNGQKFELFDKAQVESVQETLAAVCEKADLPARKTRSGARFSDDTSMLKDFLNRAQARKAAKDTLEVPKSLQESPRRSPRKALRSQGSNESTPNKSKDLTPKRIASRPGTPSTKWETGLHETDEVENQIAEPASCRRSARTRLPAPAKAPPGAPSFIPVRRADGTDPVVLQKSQAQELAMFTRANTRRNKGQAKPPLLALQDLPVESGEVATTIKQGAAQAKAVAWAEKLASYQDSSNAREEAGDDQRPKIRRMRAPGAAVNGTPAAKKTTAVVASSNGTPAPKRRGKIR